jgi:type IV fimbrial biogenesis protein FimT
MRPAMQRGFSLIELMIAIALFAVLVLLALPLFGEFLTNTQIRNAAETTLAGLRQAQAEAVKENGPVSFVLTPGTGWQVVSVDPDVGTIQQYNFAEGSARAVVTPSPAAATEVTFNGLGRIQDNPAADPRLTCVKVTSSGANTHPLNVAISGTGGFKMCDPNFTAPDPLACPADDSCA